MLLQPLINLWRLPRRGETAPRPPRPVRVTHLSRDQVGAELVYACENFEHTLRQAARVAGKLPLDVAPEDDHMPLAEVVQLATGQFLRPDEVPLWRAALGVRCDYLLAKRPPTRDLRSAVIDFRALELRVRDRLGSDAPPPLARPEPRLPL